MRPRSRSDELLTELDSLNERLINLYSRGAARNIAAALREETRQRAVLAADAPLYCNVGIEEPLGSPVCPIGIDELYD